MAYLVGVVLAMVIASYDALSDVMGGSQRALFAESAVMIVLLIIAIVGFKRNLWLLVVALVAHGAFDFVHADLIADPGVPRS
jgi:hypothetical protein